MKYRLTILNSVTFVFLAGCIVYTLLNYSTLSAGEGWGVVYMAGLFFFGLTGLVADLIIQHFLKKKNYQNVAGLITLVVYLLLFFLGS